MARRIAELQASGKYAEALPLAERLVALAKSRYGEASTDYANALEKLAATHFNQQNFDRAEPIYQQVIAIRERSLGPSHESVLDALDTLATLHRLNRRPDLSQSLSKRVLAAREDKLGRDHPALAEPLRNLADAEVALQSWGEAEGHIRRALALSEKVGRRKPTDRAQLFGTLADIELGLGRSDAAERSLKQALGLHEEAARAGGVTPNAQFAHMYALLQLSGLYQQSDRPQEGSVLAERVVSMMEKLMGPDHPNVATQLEVVAGSYEQLRRYAEAETLRKRAIAINERAYGREHPTVALSLQGLGHLYRLQDRNDEALQLQLRAFEIAEKQLGPDHPTLVQYLTEVAELYRMQQRLADAEPLLKRALTLLENAQGVSPVLVGSRKIVTLQALGFLYVIQGRHQEGRPYLDRALTISQDLFGPDHSSTGTMLQSIAIQLLHQGQTDEAEQYLVRALPIVQKTGDESGQADHWAGMGMVHFMRSDWARAHAAIRDAAALYLALDQRAGVAAAKPGAAIPHAEAYLLQAVTAFHLAETDAAAADALRDEAFQMMQRAQSSQAATSVGQMAARFASGTGALANLLRERQDMAAEWRMSDKQLTDALSALPAQRNSEKEQALRSRLQAMAAKLATLDQRVAREFPAYATLTNPEPLSVADVQKLLAPSEALVLIASRRDEQSLAWVVTQSAVQWALLPLGETQLGREVAALRCGLDTAAWDADAQFSCASALGTERIADRPLPFDTSRAHALHEALFGPFLTAIKDKHLLVAATGPLAALPLSVLVTEKPTSAFPSDASGYADVAWLAKSHAVSVLPSVASLASLRGVVKPSAARNPFLGIGNPLLSGPSGQDRRAWNKQACTEGAKPSSVRVAARAVADKYNKLFRGTLADNSVLRRQAPLPETADELCAVARDLGAREADVALGSRATETVIKQLNDRGQLAGYRVLHFATHGLLAGETESLGSSAEPALLLTPPDKPTDADDGLLTASEVAKLRLDADWVVLSACNTAAGGKAGAQPFSGLAGAFFYAGARALLVSHWYVDSEAAVKLVTTLFAEAKRDPSAGRAEAVRRAMLSVMADRSRPAEWSAAHPSVWAPFVVVGESGAR